MVKVGGRGDMLVLQVNTVYCPTQSPIQKYIIIGISGWGISWYLNGLLIPKVEVYRGFQYTFIVEGGSDPSNPARYHPFYITSSDRGGLLIKSEEEQQVSTDSVYKISIIHITVQPVTTKVDPWSLKFMSKSSIKLLQEEVVYAGIDANGDPIGGES